MPSRQAHQHLKFGAHDTPLPHIQRLYREQGLHGRGLKTRRQAEKFIASPMTFFTHHPPSRLFQTDDYIERKWYFSSPHPHSATVFPTSPTLDSERRLLVRFLSRGELLRCSRETGIDLTGRIFAGFVAPAERGDLRTYSLLTPPARFFLLVRANPATQPRG